MKSTKTSKVSKPVVTKKAGKVNLKNSVKAIPSTQKRGDGKMEVLEFLEKNEYKNSRAAYQVFEKSSKNTKVCAGYFHHLFKMFGKRSQSNKEAIFDYASKCSQTVCKQSYYTYLKVMKEKEQPIVSFVRYLTIWKTAKGITRMKYPAGTNKQEFTVNSTLK